MGTRLAISFLAILGCASCARTIVDFTPGDSDGDTDLQTFLSDGLVGYWPLDVGEARDLVGSRDGIPRGNVIAAQGRIDGGLHFDGNAALVVGDPADGSLDFGTGSFTIAFWVFVESYVTTYTIPLHKGGHAVGAAGFDVEMTNSGWSTNVGDAVVLRSGYFGSGPLGQWVHLAMTIDRDMQTIQSYRDGGLRSSTSLAPFGSIDSDYPLAFGDTAVGGGGLVGLLDDVRLYARALTLAEVAQLAAWAGGP